MNARSYRLLVFSFILSALGLPAWAVTPTPLVEFLFNDSGTTTASGGVNNTLSGTMYNAAGAVTNLHGAASSGLTGVAADIAFDNTASTAMGSTGIGGRVSVGATSITTGLTSFTVTGWFKSDAILDKGASFVSNFSASGGLRVRGADVTPGVLLLGVNGTEVSANIVKWNATSSWVFFAVTYDGTATTNNVRFYVGDSATAVSLQSTQTLNKSSVAASTGDLTLGDFAGGNIRPYDGLLDNIRLFGVTSGISGALSAVQLEAIRASDLTPVPEPAAAAALLGASGLGLACWRRNRR